MAYEPIQKNPEVDLYKILNVRRSASPSKIRKGFRVLAKIHHPDRPDVKDGSEMKKITFAKDILLDERKRKLYDKYGINGLNDPDPPSVSSLNSIEEQPSFFLCGTKPKKPDLTNMNVGFERTYLHAELKCTLRDIYLGNQIKIKITQAVACCFCSSQTAQENKQLPCPRCHGNGYITSGVQYTKSGKMRQTMKVCALCSGSGSKAHRTQCNYCKGEKITYIKKPLFIKVERGMVHGQELVFVNEAYCVKSKRLVDLHLKLNVVPRDDIHFQLMGHDLVLAKKVPLYSALSGNCVYIKHLDNRILKISPPKDSFIKADLIYLIPGEGMPLFRSNRTGDLFVKFKIIFPKCQLSVSQVLQLQEILQVQEDTEDETVQHSTLELANSYERAHVFSS